MKNKKKISFLYLLIAPFWKRTSSFFSLVSAKIEKVYGGGEKTAVLKISSFFFFVTMAPNSKLNALNAIK